MGLPPNKVLLTRAHDDSDASASACFLCALPGDLVIFEDEDFVCLAGLGPLVEGYCLVATRPHVKSMADLPARLISKRDALVSRVRRRLTEEYQRCLVTEHGRMVVCDDGTFDAHCYHGHFLLFPGTHDISPAASTYFGKRQSFSDLAAAMAHAATCDEYTLISPDPNHFNIFSVPLNLPRQFSRILVAANLGKLADAHWGDHPQRDRALAIASNLRRLLRD
jgi:diadenosine tetraphosphate (Ap4A) HIT family hydrolase